MSNTHAGAHPAIPRMIRSFSVPILLGWLALTVIVNVVVPQLETVGQSPAVSMACPGRRAKRRPPPRSRSARSLRPASTPRSLRGHGTTDTSPVAGKGCCSATATIAVAPEEPRSEPSGPTPLV